MPDESGIKEYLSMQRLRYDERAAPAIVVKDGVLPGTEGVVGSYDKQEAFPYDNNILRHFYDDERESAIFEYGCGPGRNLLRLAKLGFGIVAGTDISPYNIANAEKLLDLNGFKNRFLQHNDGCHIPCSDDLMDVVFEVICLQHICSYSIRSIILSEMARVTRPGGIMVCQFGFNSPNRIPSYYVDYKTDKHLGVTDTNGACDCCVTDERQLSDDFERIGMDVIEIWHTPWVEDPNHDDWVWIAGRKRG